MRPILFMFVALCPATACSNDTSAGHNPLAPFTSPVGGPKVSPDASCNAYLACVLITTPTAYATALTAYGNDSVCWKDPSAQVGCAQACEKSIEQLKSGRGTDCCQSDDDCGGGHCETKTGLCQCTSTSQCSAGVCKVATRSCDDTVSAVLACAIGYDQNSGSSVSTACLGSANCCNVDRCLEMAPLVACARNNCAGEFGQNLTYCVENACYSQLNAVESSSSQTCTAP